MNRGLIILAGMLFVSCCSNDTRSKKNQELVMKIVHNKGEVMFWPAIAGKKEVCFLLCNEKGDDTVFMRFSEVELNEMSNSTDRTIANFASGMKAKLSKAVKEPAK